MIHAIARQSKNICLGVMFVAVIGLGALHANDAEAKGYSGGGRSYSAPRTSYRAAPKPAPRVVKTQNVQHVTVNRTTVVHQSAPSASSGIMSSMVGSFAGTSLANWWFNSDDDDKKESTDTPQGDQPQAPAQVPTPAQ